MVFKQFMVSATYVPSQDVLKQQTTETANLPALMELNMYVSVSLDASYCYCSLNSRDQDRPSLEGATSSLCKFSTVSRHFGAETKICALQICAIQNITLRFQGTPGFIEI